MGMNHCIQIHLALNIVINEADKVWCDLSGAEDGLFRKKNQFDNMVVDALLPWVAKTSAAVILSMCEVHVGILWCAMCFKSILDDTYLVWRAYVGLIKILWTHFAL